MSDPLQSPIRLGDLELRNRVAMAPCTRCMSPGHLPTESVAAYYGRRARDGVGLLITEGTIICRKANGYPDVPGIWSDEQVVAWRRVTDEVHQGGGRIVCQIWHTGTYAHSRLNGGVPSEGPSGVPPEGFHSRLREDDGSKVAYESGETMSEERILEVVELFRQAAANSIAAGFDGVEIHGAHTYLIDQFTNLNWNLREDDWGGDNRCRFAGEVTRAVVDEIGPGRVLFRFSPYWSDGQRAWKRPSETLPLLLSTLRDAGLRLLHASSPSYDLPTIPVEVLADEGNGAKERVAAEQGASEPGTTGHAAAARSSAHDDSADPVDGKIPLHAATRALWDGQLIGVGELTLERAREALADDEIDVAAFGRLLIANPDFASRVAEGAALRAYDASMLSSLD